MVLSEEEKKKIEKRDETDLRIRVLQAFKKFNYMEFNYTAQDQFTYTALNEIYEFELDHIEEIQRLDLWQNV